MHHLFAFILSFSMGSFPSLNFFLPIGSLFLHLSLNIPTILTANVIYTNQWAVRIRANIDKTSIDRLAAENGFLNFGPIIDDYYLFVAPSIPKRSKRSAKRHIDRVTNFDWVLEANQQIARKRVKRNVRKVLKPEISIINPNDPEWQRMWYLNDEKPGHNIKEAWQLGITGKDVVVTILDDGLESTHPDIKPNYNPMASFDVNNNDADPTPRYGGDNDNRHGTRCAGEVAAVFNNSLCAVGVAHGATIGGIKMLDGDVTDAVEAASLSHNRQHIDIYSASWGPDDDGKSLDGPDKMTVLAFKEGIQQGRRNLGSIFVWASGNGGAFMDNCNCDGYANSIYTLAVSSVSERGLIPWYSEPCSASLATTYSSGAPDERLIVTTDLYQSCTDRHTGTSASAPLAAGMCALALEANPRLTWRDMQHLVARTARPHSLQSADWRLNGRGRNVSHRFGYGLMDALAMVKMARRWRGSGEQQTCRLKSGMKSAITPNSFIEKKFTVNADDCKESGRHVAFLEHVVAAITMNVTGRRGDIQISLVAPSGTKSILLDKRANDANRKGFRAWPFMTVHCWGENPVGTWTLIVQNDGSSPANLLNFDLILYGTREEISDDGIISMEKEISSSLNPSSSCCIESIFGICAGCPNDLILHKNQCLESCPEQYFTYNNEEINPFDPELAQCQKHSIRCKPCWNHCQNCMTNMTTEKCNTFCIGGFQLKNGTCEPALKIRRPGEIFRNIYNHYNQLMQANHKLTNPNLENRPAELPVIFIGAISIGGCGLLLLFTLMVSHFWKNCHKPRTTENGPVVVTVAQGRAEQNFSNKPSLVLLWQHWLWKKPVAQTPTRVFVMPPSQTIESRL